MAIVKSRWAGSDGMLISSGFGGTSAKSYMETCTLRNNGHCSRYEKSVSTVWRSYVLVLFISSRMPVGCYGHKELQDRSETRASFVLVLSWCPLLLFVPELAYLLNSIKIPTIDFDFFICPIQMENISKFLDVALALGVAKTDLFQTVDLYEATNIPGVIYRV
jgi:hypothetical protein